jgi:hypothetical protein
MSESNAAISGLSLLDRIAILEDQLASQCERNLMGVAEIFNAVAYLGGTNQPDLSAEVLRARVSHVCAALTRLAHELAIRDLSAKETQAALARSSLVASHPE